MKFIWIMYENLIKIPFYKLLVNYLQNGLNLLDEQGLDEIFQFLISQQNPDGGFQDRGGKSDLYYSLFGALMLMAVEKITGDRRPETEDEPRRRVDPMWSSFPTIPDSHSASESILKLKQYISQQSNSDVPGFIERCCLVLLQKELKTKRTSRIKSIFSLGKSFWEERSSINLSYRSFVLFLTLDAVLPFRAVLKIGAKRMFSKSTIDLNSPSSEVAAKVFLQKMMNQDGSEEQELLKTFICKSGGFKAFAHLDQADMLSTAVALFALDFTGCDLRLLKPACLDFIGQNFSEGAFLSGDGDTTADVEYTFYGLLALGVLAR